MHKNLRYIFILLAVFAGSNIRAQQPLADSLKLLLETDLPDTTRAYNMVMLAMYTEPVDIDKAHALYKEAVEFSLRKKLDYYAGLALYFESTPYDLSGNHKQQKDNLFRAVRLFENSNHSKAGAQLGAAYGGLSRYYRSTEKLDSAVIASIKSITILEGLKLYKSLAISCMNLAMIYQQIKLPQKQREYVDKAAEYANLSGEKDIIMLSFLQKAHYLTEVEDFKGAKACADSATLYFSGNYEFSRKQNYYLLKASTFQNVNEYDSAIVYFQKCFELAETTNSRWNMPEPLIQIGYIYLQQKKYSLAEKYVMAGLDIARIDSFRIFMKEGYQILSDIYYVNGNYRLAFETLGKYNELKDTLQSEELKKFALDLDKKYQTDKREDQTRLHELEISKRKSIIHGLLALTFTILVIFFLAIHSFRQKNRLHLNTIKTLETEKQLLATEAVLKGEEQERTRLAKDLHDGLGGLLSGIKYSFQNMKDNLILTPENAQTFERSLDMLDSSIHEMRSVAHNLMPESLFKFGLDTALNDYCSVIDNSGIVALNYQSFGLKNADLEQSLTVSVYRIIQELVNNVVKHSRAQHALVQVTLDESQVLIDVEDNGKGFEAEELNNLKGIGWTNIRSRIEFLKGTFSLKSEIGKGTVVHIEINRT